MRTLERDDSAVLPGMFRISVAGPKDPEPSIQAIPGSYALIGRTDGCTCCLDDPAVGWRHVYLQGLYGRIYGIDLGSQDNTLWDEKPRRQGWLDPEQTLGIGPFRVQLVDTLGLGTGAEQLSEDFDPLSPYAGQFGPLPKVAIEVLSTNSALPAWTISRVVTLVGSSSRCQLRLHHKSVSTVHCSLLWLRDGLWVVNLAGKGGTRVRGKPVQCAKLADGQRLRIGQFSMRVRYSGALVTRIDPAAVPANAEYSAAQSEQRPITVGGEGGDKKGDSAQFAVEREALAAERADLAAQRQSLDSRIKQVESREAKLGEAQQRLAAEWDAVHAERDALATLGENVTKVQAELASQAHALVEEAEALSRQRSEMAAREAELTSIRRRLKVEWKKLEAARERTVAVRHKLNRERDQLEQEKGEPRPHKPDLTDEDGLTAVEFDIVQPESAAASSPAVDEMESTRHNKVFRTERVGKTLIVTPLGDAPDFFNRDLHTEANKVRRLLEGGNFEHLVVDLGIVPEFGNVMIKVFVNWSQILTHRGGRAVLCGPTEKTRGVLQAMKLLELWPIFDDRTAALRSLGEL